jgi:HEAT repeat protein
MSDKSFVIFILALALLNLPLTPFAQAPAAAGVAADVHREMTRLQGRSPRDKVKALRRLAAMGERAAPAVPLIVELLDSNQRYETIGDRIMNFVSLLGTSGVFVSQEARKTLVKIGPPSVGPLITALGQSRPKVRSNAALTLGDIHDLGAVEPLEDALANDSSPDVRIWSAEALGSMADYWSPTVLETLVPPLVRALDDESMDVCQHAANSLGKIKNEKAVPPLIRTLRKRGKNSGAGVALFMITGERFGDDPAKWQEWWDGRHGQDSKRKEGNP